MANTAPSLNRWRIGFDIGGTFTDFILYDAAAGTVRLHKRLTTPHDPSEAALLGLEELVAMGGITLAEVGEIIHGTTLVTNAVIERKGAKLGLITTQGFRDVGEMHAVRRTDLRGRDYYWMSFRGQKQEHADGTDLRAIDEGRISVTPLHIDLTHMASVNDLKKVLGGAPPKTVIRAA